MCLLFPLTSPSARGAPEGLPIWPALPLLLNLQTFIHGAKSFLPFKT